MPRLIVLVVYKKKDGTWRGFCAPFDITCEAKTENKAMEVLEELVECYKEGLKQYNYPEHLTVKELTNEEDRKMFAPILKEIAEQVKKMIVTRYYQCVDGWEPLEIKKPNIKAYSFDNHFAEA